MLYTIGYSNRPLAEFQHELLGREITQIIDVRSSPWSRYPAYNRMRIEEWAECSGLVYRYAGGVLGGASEIDIADSRYVTALGNIATASRTENVAIMCAEGDPTKCHRTWDIAACLLVQFDVAATSILRDGSEEPVIATLARTSSKRFAPAIAEPVAEILGKQSSLKLKSS